MRGVHDRRRHRLYWLDPAIPRLLDDSLPSNPASAARLCEDRLREALLLLSATRLFNQLYERNTRCAFFFRFLFFISDVV